MLQSNWATTSLCFSCCSWFRFLTLKMRFVLFTDIKCYVPITHFVPQGLERIYASSLHLAFMSEHNVASGDLWHADKSKGSVHPNLFSHFICTISCWRNCPPWTIINALRWISIFYIKKFLVLNNTEFHLSLLYWGVSDSEISNKSETSCMAVLDCCCCCCCFFTVFWWTDLLCKSVNDVIMNQGIKMFNNILYLLTVPRLSVAKTYLDHSFSGRSIKIFRIKGSWLLFERFFSVWLRIVPDV